MRQRIGAWKLTQCSRCLFGSSPTRSAAHGEQVEGEHLLLVAVKVFDEVPGWVNVARLEEGDAPRLTPERPEELHEFTNGSTFSLESNIHALEP